MNATLRFDRAWLRTPRAACDPRALARGRGDGRAQCRHLAEASRLLAEMAASDAAGVARRWLRCRSRDSHRLSRDRQVNLVRWWLRQQGLRPPPAARLDAAHAGIPAARRGRGARRCAGTAARSGATAAGSTRCRRCRRRRHALVRTGTVARARHGARPLRAGCRERKAGLRANALQAAIASGFARAERACGRTRDGRASVSRISARKRVSCPGCGTACRSSSSASNSRRLATSGSTRTSPPSRAAGAEARLDRRGRGSTSAGCASAPAFGGVVGAARVERRAHAAPESR